MFVVVCRWLCVVVVRCVLNVVGWLLFNVSRIGFVVCCLVSVVGCLLFGVWCACCVDRCLMLLVWPVHLIVYYLSRVGC